VKYLRSLREVDVDQVVTVARTKESLPG
jgi:hypothetical protein